MKASELRIGNFVEYNGMTLRVSEIYSPKPRQPKEFSDVECVELHCDGFIAATIHEINPIELTEEILVKCGFKTTSWDNHSTFWNMFCSDGSMVISLEHKYIAVGDLTLDIEVKYLHQLQNLFYAITGKELI